MNMHLWQVISLPEKHFDPKKEYLLAAFARHWSELMQDPLFSSLAGRPGCATSATLHRPSLTSYHNISKNILFLKHFLAGRLSAEYLPTAFGQISRPVWPPFLATRGYNYREYWLNCPYLAAAHVFFTSGKNSEFSAILHELITRVFFTECK